MYAKAGELQKKSQPRRSKESTDHIRIQRLMKIISDLCSKNSHLGGKKILDIGCGDGSLIAPFCEYNDCYGVDIIDHLIQLSSKKGINAYTIDLDTNRLPFDDEFFDIVICAQVIEHLINTDHVLSEINRILKRKRFLILSFPNINQPASLLLQLFLDYPPIFAARYKSPHVRDFTLKTIKIALENNGFKIKNIEGTTIFPFKNSLARALAKRFPKLSERIILVAQKVRNPYKLPELVGDLRLLSLLK